MGISISTVEILGLLLVMAKAWLARYGSYFNFICDTGYEKIYGPSQRYFCSLLLSEVSRFVTEIRSSVLNGASCSVLLQRSNHHIGLTLAYYTTYSNAVE